MPAAVSQPVTPKYVNIESKQIPLPAGFGYGLHSAIPGRPDWPAIYWLVKYDSDSTQPGESWLATDENGFILGMEIRPEDEARFQPFLDAASKKPTPTPQPLVKIGGREVLLPSGMNYSQIFWSNTDPGPPDLAWVVTYSDSTAVSRIYIDDDAGSTVLKAEIRREHLSLFAPLLNGGGGQ